MLVGRSASPAPGAASARSGPSTSTTTEATGALTGAFAPTSLADRIGRAASSGWPSAACVFAKLAEINSNGDGSIDAKDAQFSDLRVWIDQDQDRFFDGSELKSLQEMNVAGLSG